MTQMLELSDWEFKATVIHILGALMEIEGNVQEQMYNVNSKMKTIRIKRK